MGERNYFSLPVKPAYPENLFKDSGCVCSDLLDRIIIKPWLDIMRFVVVF